MPVKSSQNSSMELLRKLRALQFRLTRRLLFAWIKPTLLGCDRETLGLSDDDLICYVLPFRSVADLLVVDMACERQGLPKPTKPMANTEEDRSFFFLGRPEGTFGRRTLRQQSERMNRLFEHQSELTRHIKLVPVSLFWGHQPDREQSVFKLLLSEHWSATSRLKKFLAILFHRSHILVQFGSPLSLADIINNEPDDRPRQVRRLLRLLRVHFNNQKQAIIGPDLSHRRTLINTILESREVQGAIEKTAGNEGSSYEVVEKRAQEYAHEIASDQSYRVIRFFDVLLTWLWNNLYDGIQVHNINQLKQLAESHEIIYTPCHRSHIDYLLLSYVLYHNGLTPPHIAAGKNLNLPLIGPLLRRAGAFFMRRSFRGDNLYKEIFDEYLHQMFTKGYSVEYFIEGGRSRTGRTLPPRTGMLSMTVRSFQKDATKPIAMMPVYFGYERILESSSYQAELAGRNKQTESVFDVFGIFSSFKHDFGEVTVNFGEPVLLKEFLDEKLPGWQTPEDITEADFSQVCVNLGQRLAKNINAAVAIQSTHLVALALLSTERQSIEEQHLRAQVALLRDIADGCGPIGLTMTEDSVEDILETAIKIIGLERTEREFGTIISATPDQAIDLTYNANSVMHVFALPSLICRYVRVSNRTDRERLTNWLRTIYPYLRAEMFLPWQDVDLPYFIDRAVTCLTEVGVLVDDNGQLHAPSPESRAYNCLQDVSRISDSTLERFYIVVALLQQDSTVTLRGLESAAAGIAAMLSSVYRINSPDFFQKSLFTTFIATLQQQGQVSASLERQEAFDQLEIAISRTLNPDVRYNILQAISHRQRELAGPAAVM